MSNNYEQEAYFFETPADYAEYLKHYGIKYRSGRYPYGSGEDPYQHELDWYGRVKDLRRQGLTNNQIAEMEGISTTEFRARVSNARAAQRSKDRAEAIKLRDHGYSVTEIARRMYGSASKESTVRSLLDEERAKRNDLNRETADTLKAFVDEKKYLDIGAGTELDLGVSEERLKKAVALLEQEGYKKQYLRIDQMGTDHQTTLKVLTKDDVPWTELNEHKYEVQTIGSKIIDIDGTRAPAREFTSLDSSRVFVRYGDQGGSEKDGLIELRRGVDDISLGNAMYAQTRIAVDGKYYMKGMCYYSDDIPDGYDVVYNSNKPSGSPPEVVFKELKSNKDNPFGASLKMDEDDVTLTQRYYYDKNGKKLISAINVVNEEGDWGKWGKSLASQMVSKQSVKLAKRQLDLDYANKLDEFDDICKLTNPTIKRKLLSTFANGCDAAAVDLKAAPLPGQSTSVILPFPELKDNEVYAPNYKDGDQVCLIRYPHGGTFEIPTLTVKNRGSAAEKSIKNAPDAIGINAKVAERLSGADFDGDTVVVIPVNKTVKIRTSPPLEDLKGFDPKKEYPGYPGMEVISNKRKQTEMGKVTNLITDMTLMGAPENEIARAVKHSMVIIDAEKHKLDYKRSYVDNDIASLKEKYQGGKNSGAVTIISRAKGRYDVNARKDMLDMDIDPATGKINWRETGEFKRKKGPDGKYYVTDKKVTQQSTKMLETDDAFTLTSGGSKENPGYPMEAVYAKYANQMKALANRARKEYIATPKLKQNPEAKKAYAPERASLISKLNNALKNAPLERQAQLYADKISKQQILADPTLDAEHKKKIRGQALVTARERVGAKKKSIDITDREWEAIQAGAISDTKLKLILDNTKLDKLRERATPRATTAISSAKQAKIKAMSASGYSTAEIAEACGISATSVQKYIHTTKAR